MASISKATVSVFFFKLKVVVGTISFPLSASMMPNFTGMCKISVTACGEAAFPSGGPCMRSNSIFILPPSRSLPVDTLTS